jgi:hypothetical protein
VHARIAVTSKYCDSCGLISAVRMKLSARPAPVRASVGATSEVTTTIVAQSTDFCTNRTTKAPPKMLLLASVNRGSLAFPDRFINGSDAAVHEISVAFRRLR